MTKKYADELHRTIARGMQAHMALQRENDALLEAQRVSGQRELALKQDIEAERAKVDRMGKDLGKAAHRLAEIQMIADGLVNGLQITAAAAGHGAMSSTLLTLARDGQTRLAKVNQNGASA